MGENLLEQSGEVQTQPAYFIMFRIELAAHYWKAIIIITVYYYSVSFSVLPTYEGLGFVTNCGALSGVMKQKFRIKQIDNGEISTLKIPYLLAYNSIPCVSRAPILEPENKFFLLLGKNFLEKLIFYLRIFFQVHYGYTKNLSWTCFGLSF